jgi:hypothetical protein
MTKLAAVQQLTRTQFHALQARFPDSFELGGCLLLGRRYAHPASRALVLGINPGISPSTDLDVGLQQHDFLLEGPDRPRHQYFTNARKFFNSSPAVLDIVRLATFSFCCPFRTASWSDLSDGLRSALVESSRPILARIVRDCVPALIVVAGVDGFRVMTETLAGDVQVRRAVSHGGSAGTYQWCAYDARINSRAVVIAQVPHFSRANSTPRLQECAGWLLQVAAQTA